MRIPLLCLLVVAASPLTGPAALAQDAISRVKTAPQEFRDRQIRLEGEVVELRAISPRSGQGLYRLVDPTDRVGVLIRTRDLPNTGGPFRIRARLSPELISDGVLMLDELDRSAAELSLLPLAALLGGAGLIAAVITLTMLLKTRRAQRHMRLSPPMWLIPTGAGPPEAAHGTEQRFNYNLQYVEEERSEKLDRRQRALIGVLALATSVGVAGSGWFALLSREEAARPSFVLVTPEAVGEVPELPTARDSTVARRSDDTLRLGLELPGRRQAPPPAPAPPPPPPPSRSRQEVAAQEPPPRRPPEPRDTARRVPTQTPRDTVVTQPAPVVVVLPPPPPVAPPPPPPSRTPAISLDRRDSVESRAPAVNPEALRAEAAVELRAGIERFVEAIRTRQPGVVDLMYSPEQGEDANRKTKFIGFLKEASPGASLAGIDQTAVTETSGGTRFTLQFRWRGDFGVDRRKAVVFWAAARREGSRWAFSGVRLLESFP